MTIYKLQPPETDNESFIAREQLRTFYRDTANVKQKSYPFTSTETLAPDKSMLKRQLFPKESEQPDFYKMVANVGELTNKPGTELFIAVSSDDKIAVTVVYFGDMKYYGSGGTATIGKNASGFRLLAVDLLTRRQGIGKLLTNECIRKAREKKHSTL